MKRMMLFCWLSSRLLRASTTATGAEDMGAECTIVSPRVRGRERGAGFAAYTTETDPGPGCADRRGRQQSLRGFAIGSGGQTAQPIANPRSDSPAALADGTAPWRGA